MAMSRPDTRLSTRRAAAGCLWTCLGCALVLLSRPVLGNIRAPEILPQGPSTAAFPVGPAEGLEVLREELSFKCGASCAVEARYRIRAREAVTLDLSFVLPVRAPLRVTVGSKSAPARIADTPEGTLKDADLPALERLNPLPRTFQATFTAPFVAGENTVVVAYDQPLGKHEHGHGYFTKGRFTDFFRYELWPLSEWHHAPGFRIDGEVVIDRPPPSWWKRTFSQPRAVGCFFDRGDRYSLEQRGDQLRLVFRFVDPLPKRLWCHIGDQDLVPR
jgi:hypothetical protein